MARQTINIGTTANDGTGDPLRTAFDKINDNFIELYGSDSDATTFDNPTLVGALMTDDLDLNGNKIISASNGNITLDPQGTGTIELTANTNITGAATVSSTLNVTGLSTLASLKLASGATVTSILDEDAMGSNSDTALATQQSIKAYVDSQVTAQDLDFACDDSTALSIDLDSESLQFSGGTGITTAGTGNTVTIAIDNTVATLTGLQTLTNKTLTSPSMTGTVTIDNVLVNDSEISTSSNANLNLNPGGTGTIEAQANTNVTGTLTSSGALTVSAGGANITGTLVTDDITTVGNQTITGSLTVNGSGLNVDGININDTTIGSDSNANISITPGGTGTIELTTTTNVTGTATVTGQFNADNIRIDGNTISSTSGGITLDAGGQNIQSNSKIIAGEINTTLLEATSVRTDKLQNDISNGDIQIDTQGTGVVDFRTATQGTVGSAGGASALPATPTGYLEVKISGTAYVIPYYAKS
jgi:hypothetical protein